MRSGQPIEDELDRGESPRERPGSRMSRYYGGADVYGRRRLVAGVCILVAVVVLFAMLGGC